MDIVLDDRDVRILGSLIEKEMTTPEYYPLSLNALTNACNQKSNRDPVVSLDEASVTLGLDNLLAKGLARKTIVSGSRVTKYVHAFLDRFDLSRQEMAVLCELMVRGPQTAGELRARAERMAAFADLEQVGRTLQGLIEHDPPLAAPLPKQAGKKEIRYMHLLSGGVDTAPDVQAPSAPPAEERIGRLEDEIARLRGELEELKRAFTEFKSQF
jgi:uncharacterized protein